MADLWLNLESQDQSFVPDRDSYLTVSVAILCLVVLRENNKLQVLHPQTNIILTFNMLIMEFMQNSNKVVRCTTIEILLWLFHDNSKISMYCVDSSEDIVILEQVMKIINTLDKNEYKIKDMLDEWNISTCLVQLLKEEDNPSFIRQVYNLCMFVSNIVDAYVLTLRIRAYFVKQKSITINNLYCIMNKINQYPLCKKIHKCRRN